MTICIWAQATLICVEVGAALDDGYKQGVLPQRPALVNLQCDIDHPTQSMADLAWLREHFGSLENLKGKKIAMTWAYSQAMANRSLYHKASSV